MGIGSVQKKNLPWPPLGYTAKQSPAVEKPTPWRATLHCACHGGIPLHRGYVPQARQFATMRRGDALAISDCVVLANSPSVLLDHCTRHGLAGSPRRLHALVLLFVDDDGAIEQ